MNIYVALGLILSIMAAACICAYKAYRKGLSDGLEISKSQKLKETIIEKKREKTAVDQVDEKKLLNQLEKLQNF